MKSIKYFGLALVALLCSAGFTSCSDDDVASGDQAMAIKVFSPTKVVTGQPVTINGTGLDDVTEVVFPGGIAVTDFEKVSDEMIRVITPAGINIAEGGEKLVVRSASEKAESPRVMTQGCTVPSSYSAQPDEDVPAKSILKIFGKDMEFVNKATFLDKDDNIIELEQKDFFRIATNSLSIKIPANIKLGKQVGTFETFDGKQFELPEYNYVAASGGHWETVKKVLWENETGEPTPAWGGTFRFGLEGTEDPNNPCIALFDADTWSLIKEGTVRVEFEYLTDAPHIRITTGWWSNAYGGDKEHNSLEFVQEDENGAKYIDLNIKEEGTLYDLIDQQNLLFTGDGNYILKSIYVVDQIWVEDAEGHWELQALWENKTDEPTPAWGGKFRFGLEGTEDPNNPCIAQFDADTWSLIKEGTVRVVFKFLSDAPHIRITTGWWSNAYGGDKEHNSLEFVQEDENGVKYIDLNIKEEGTLYDLIDQQNLLFTGDGNYILCGIYVNRWVEKDASTSKDIVFWENETGEPIPSWGGTFRFGLEGTEDAKNPCAALFDAETWSLIKDGTLCVLYDGGDDANVRITTGWWKSDFGGKEYNCNELAEIDAETGKKLLKIKLSDYPELYDLLDEQNLLFTGDKYTLLKLYCTK